MTYEVHKDKIVMRAGQYDFEAFGREVVARWMMENGYATGHGDTVGDMLKELDWQVRERERQRLHDKFMEIHRSQQHNNNYWHFAARKIKEEL